MEIEKSLAFKTKELIKRYGFSFKKNFGQNFLVDERVLEKIIDAARIDKNDTVIEVGPGIGTLTQALAKAAGRVIAVEIDKSLIPLLEDTLSGFENIEIINEDILKVDIKKFSEQDGSVKVVANLPYYITTPVIMQILENRLPVKSITVMVQKEVAYRMKAEPASKDYGALSLAVRYYSEPYLVANVPQNCFIPRPNVDSAVIRLTIFDKPRVEVSDSGFMFKVIKAAFSQRRKTLLNCIFNSKDFSFEKEEIAEILAEAGFEEKIRGERLTLEEFANLSDIMKKHTR